MSISTLPAETACHSLDSFFSQSALQYSGRAALFAGGQYWSYGEVDAQSRAIEQVLDACAPAGKGRNVGLAYGRSMFSYAAIIGILRSRCVYVPLNPKMPTEKLLRVLQDADIGTVIVDGSEGLSEGLAGLLHQASALQILVSQRNPGPALENALQSSSHQVWRVSQTPNGEPPSLKAAAAEAADGGSGLAYIIYTSGSTGIPKGVAITHESAWRCIEKAHRLFGTHEEDRFTGLSALSFDVSILDLFLCWKSGGTLYVPAGSEALVPFAFVVKHRITVWSSVPSLANFLLKLGLLKSNALPHVRLFLFCGEALPVELARGCLRAAPRSRVLNLYGPTECTIFATVHEYRDTGDAQGGMVPIGAPLPGLSHRIVAEDRIVEEEDVPGELWLTGDQLASGYWNNPAATRAAFVSTAENGSRAQVWYRTGDLVSYRAAVGLIFRGRLDRQVKLRGHRVELQEIESALRKVIGCALVAVVPVRNSGGICEKIIAYCDELREDEATIKSRCSKRLATYMVPDRIVRLEAFPLSASGKIDYLALAAAARHPEPMDTERRLSALAKGPG